MNIPKELILYFERQDVANIETYLQQRPELLAHKDLLSRGVRHGNLAVVSKLYEMGASHIQEALGAIVYGKKRAIAEYLIELGADVMKGDGYGPVPLGACEVLNSYVLNLSLELANQPLSEQLGKACLAMVLSTYTRNPREKHACLHILEMKGITLPDTPAMLLHKGEVEHLRKLIVSDSALLNRRLSEAEIYPPELGIQPGDGLHLTPLNGASLLHMAVEYDELASLAMLLEAGANPNIASEVNDKGLGGHTAIFHTVVSYVPEDTQKAQLLLDHGADPHKKASFTKQLKYIGDPELEKPREYIQVSPIDYAAQFPIKRWVSEASIRTIQAYPY